ncbi:MAG: alpha/beta fold hydrolase [Actinomycetota bacterium]
MGAERDTPEIRFARSNGARLAWQEFGSGDETVIAIPPAAQNIETAWEWPELRAMFERFGSFCRYVHYDKRGTGASDRGRGVPGLDERVDDLRAVMDAAGVERAHLFAQSEGGATTLLFAATYPHRVKTLIMNGSAARLVSSEHAGDPEFRTQQLEARRRFADAWGTPETMSIGLFAPSYLGREDFRDWYVRYERTAASSEDVFDLLVQMLDMDVADVVPEIEAPMLVLHRRNDPAMPIELGRELAELAPDAVLVELDGDDHFPFVGDSEPMYAEMERWVTGTVAERSGSTGGAGVPVGSSAPTAPSITTLGRFGVTVDGEEVDAATWGSRRARVLLKRLVVAEGRPVTRDELFDLLWPDETDRARLGSRLSVQLSAVRRVLGGGVVADRDTVALDHEVVSVDLVAYLAAVDAGDDREVIERFGEFLPEHRYDDWAHAMRERVRSSFTVAAHRVATAALDADEHDRALDLGRRILDADPSDSLAHATVVDALEAMGDVAAADRQRAAWRDAAG